MTIVFLWAGVLALAFILMVVAVVLMMMMASHDSRKEVIPLRIRTNYCRRHYR